MSDMLNQNLKFLSKYNPNLANKITNYTELQANYEINSAKSGDDILYKDNIPVDDPVDPVWNSIEKYSQLDDKSTKSITVILGIGLGYTLKEFSKRYKGKIILFEPNLEFLRIALEFVDLSNELAKKNFIIANTFDDVKNAFNILFYRGYKYNFVASDYYLNYANDNLHDITNNLNNCYVTYEQTYNNLWKKNYLWSTLLFDNIVSIVKNQDLHVLKDKFKNKTAVIISAGPSLDKNIEDLKPYRDKLIVFCVGVALKTAVKHGIIPDFVAVIDNDKSILDISEIRDVNLIASTYTYNNIFELNPKRFFNYHTKTTPACTWLAKVLGNIDINDYEAAGTVAINCFYSAKLMGCDKIILIGQDLAYTDNKCYSQNSAHAGFTVNDGNTVKFEDQFGEKEDGEIKAQRAEALTKDLVYIKGLNGVTLPTRPDYYMFKLFFEDIARKYANDFELINATEGGAYLEGYKHITLKEALEKYTNDETINVEQVLSNSKLTDHEILKRKKRVLKELNFTLKNDKELKNLIFSGYKESFASYFHSEFRKTNNYEQNDNEKIKYKKAVWLKRMQRIEKLTPDEEAFVQKMEEESNKYQLNLPNYTEKLFNNEPELFSKTLKIIKDEYLKIRSLLDSNPYYKCFFLNNLLYTDHLLTDFDNEDKELINLALELTRLFSSFYSFWPLYIKSIEGIISKLEKQ